MDEKMLAMFKEKEQQNRLAYEAFCLCQKVDEAKKAADQSRALFEDTRLAVNFGGFMPDRAFLAEMNRTLVELSGADQKVAFARDTLAEADKAYQASFRDIRQMKFNNTIDEAGINPLACHLPDCPVFWLSCQKNPHGA